MLKRDRKEGRSGRPKIRCQPQQVHHFLHLDFSPLETQNPTLDQQRLSCSVRQWFTCIIFSLVCSAKGKIEISNERHCLTQLSPTPLSFPCLVSFELSESQKRPRLPCQHLEGPPLGLRA